MRNALREPLALGRAFARTVIEGNPPGSYSWHYETGLILLALWKFADRTGDGEIRAYVRRCAERLVDEDGEIGGYSIEEFNLDQVNTGKILLELAAASSDPRWELGSRSIREQLARHPRTAAGAFWHKEIYPHQVWLDGLYMQGPFAVRWGLEHGEEDLVADACDQLAVAEAKTREITTGLLHHAWDEHRVQLWADPATGRSPHPWGRAMGWYAMALVDCIELLPFDHPKRMSLETLLARTASVILAFRDGPSRLWYQVLDQAGRQGNYPESSASAMFVYAFAKGVRIGVLAAEPFREVAEDSFAALSSERVSLDAEGKAHLAGVCKVAGLGGEPYRDGSYAYYLSEPVADDDLKGVGPYILSCAELG